MVDDHTAAMTPPPFPFVVGCARSGTTLLRALLDAHPDLAVPGESYFPVLLARKRDRYERPGRFDSERFIKDLVEGFWFPQWGLTESAVRDAIATMPPVDFPQAVRRCFSAYAQAHGKARYGDKTPVFVLHIPLLAALFPEARFVHLVRDGRDTALSLLNVAWGPARFDQAALHWRSRVRAGHSAGAELGADRYLELHYEHLTTDPEPIVRRLCDFLDLAFDPAMLRYHERTDHLMKSLPYPEEHRNLTRSPARVRDWRSQLTKDQVELFAALAGNELALFNYEIGADSGAPGTKVAALAARSRWEFAQARQSARSLVSQVRRKTMSFVTLL